MNTDHSSVDLAELDAVILCGGKGTRLQSVLPDSPKPMAPIEDKPFLAHLIQSLTTSGFRHFVLCSGYRSEQIEAYFSDAIARGTVRISREQAPLGTGGALRYAYPLLRGQRCVVLNGDSFCQVDFPQMLRSHIASQSAATIAVVPVDSTSSYGTVHMTPNNTITSFCEKIEGVSGAVNAGIYLLENQVIRNITPDQPVSMEKDIFPHLAQAGQLHGILCHGPLWDIGTPERYARVRQCAQLVFGPSV